MGSTYRMVRRTPKGGPLNAGRPVIAVTAVCLSWRCTVADYKEPVAETAWAVVNPAVDTMNTIAPK